LSGLQSLSRASETQPYSGQLADYFAFRLYSVRTRKKETTYEENNKSVFYLSDSITTDKSSKRSASGRKWKNCSD